MSDVAGEWEQNYQTLLDAHMEVHKEVNALRAQRDALKAQVDRYRAALADDQLMVAHNLDVLDTDYPGTAWIRAWLADRRRAVEGGIK